MRTFTNGLVVLSLLAAPLAVACGGDDDSPADPGSGGTAGTAGQGGAGGTAGTAGTAGTGAMGGTGGGGSCDLTGAGLSKETIPNKIDKDMTLTSDKVWVLEDITYVEDGATLTIEPCTRIEGKKSPLGTLVVSRGGKIMADGKKDEPILFTSPLPAGSRSPGDWGGVIMLGKAPNFKGDNVTIEGLSDAPENQYGGSDAADSSGTLRYVRIEYSGFELSAGNEINGLTLGSVGSGTTIENVMVSNTLDDGFEWFGGSADAKWLVVNNAGDDMFDMDQGFSGNVQFLFGRQVNPLSSDPNGFECDSSKDDQTPVTTPNVSNVTLCGTGSMGPNTSFGAVFREKLAGSYTNLLITGFEIGVDTRDDFGTEMMPNVELTSSIFFGNFAHNVADDGETDNDSGFDESAWFNQMSRNNSEMDPMLGDCAAATPMPYPSAELTGDAPAAPLDTSAAYVGAFKDASDDWMTGKWVDFSAN